MLVAAQAGARTVVEAAAIEDKADETEDDSDDDADEELEESEELRELEVVVVTNGVIVVENVGVAEKDVELLEAHGYVATHSGLIMAMAPLVTGVTVTFSVKVLK